MKRMILVAFLLLLAPAVQAQTVTKSLTWSQVGEALATVSTYTWALKIDAAAAVAITPTCQTNGANTDCATPVVLASGNHTLTLTAVNTSGVSASSAPLNYVPGVPPATPANVKITIQITVP